MVYKGTTWTVPCNKECTCVQCKKIFYAKKTGTKLCSEACRNQYYSKDCAGHGELTKNCVICGKMFTTYRSQKTTCSKECQRKKHNSHNDKRYEGITKDEGISLFKLAKRDGQQCKLCGMLVDWDDKNYKNGTLICGDRYPSIDHIKPISKGGIHSWDNVQLAHRICNSYKGNKTG